MHELRQVFPDPRLIISLEPEELGSKLLFILRKRVDQSSSTQVFLLQNELATLWPNLSTEANWSQTNWSQVNREVDLALAEAWAWLVAQGLLVPAPGVLSGADHRTLSRRARRFENEAEFASFADSRLLPKELLHPNFSNVVWSAFMRREYDVAVFQAFKAVEVAVRDASKLPNELGAKLMRKAFDAKDGPLTDNNAENSEKDARSALFAGAIGCYKNSHSHRYVNLTDPAEAIEIIMLANHLLRIVDARRNLIEQ